jgi:hypothetical protein
MAILGLPKREGVKVSRSALLRNLSIDKKLSISKKYLNFSGLSFSERFGKVPGHRGDGLGDRSF